MSSPNREKTQWVSQDEVSQRLLDIPGVVEGMEQQHRLFLLGEALRDVRERFTKLSQSAAAKMMGIPQPELSRLEAGTGVRGPTYATVTTALRCYERHLVKQGIEMGLSLSVRRADGTVLRYDLSSTQEKSG